MVSTRGVKFKFSEGDRVLCYEPDPTKAKVLYESKVLELVVSRDSRARKIPEYRVHFQGWNSSWDRCVREDFVLQDNPENRHLQRKLAHDAAITFKGKKRKKLPAFFKESMKKSCLDSDNDDAETEEETSEDEDEEEEGDEQDDDEELERDTEEIAKAAFAEIKLSNILKEKLEDDCYLISAKNKLVNLPCEPNVIRILEGYVKQTAYSLLCSMPVIKGSRTPQRGCSLSFSSDIETKINLSKELVDGLRVFFDFSLPLSLLYQEEMQQYETISDLIVNSTPSPIPTLACIFPLKEEHDDRNGENKRSQTPGEDSMPWHSFQPLSPPSVTSGSNNPSQPASPSFSNSFFNNGLSGQSPAQSFFPNSKPNNNHCTNLRNFNRNLNNGGNATHGLHDSLSSLNNTTNSNNISGRTRYSSRSQSLLRDRQSPCSSIEDGSSNKRILRSSDKRNSLSEKLRLEHPSLLKNDQNSNDASIVSEFGSRSLRSNSPSISSKNAAVSIQCNTANSNSNLIRCHSPPINQNLPSLSVSSSSSTHSDSTLQNSVCKQRALSSSSSTSRLRDPSGLLNEVLSWQMLPQSVYEAKPVSPSVVYGAQHLLRLFVSLPDYLGRMNMSKRKRNTLIDGLKSFLSYLEDRSHELFPDSATYKDLEEIGTSKSII